VTLGAAAEGGAAAPRDVRLLALGDSYTIGEGVADDERWPARLVAMLRARGVAAQAPTIVARTGWTTDELWSGIDTAHLDAPYDLVTVLIGVNNQYRGRGAEEYRVEVERLLTRATHLAGGRAGRVIVMSIPDWSVTPFATSAAAGGRDRGRTASEIDAFNTINRDAAAAAGAHWIDVTLVSRRAASEPALLAPDGLHPSAAMYAEWARLLMPLVLELLA